MFLKKKRFKDAKIISRIREMPCSVCGAKPPSDPSHIKSVGSGGPDVLSNVYPMCRKCHTLWHQIGPVTFLKKHRNFKHRLFDAGWTIEQGRLRNFQLDLFEPKQELVESLF